MFTLVQTFFTGVAVTAGHELVHRKGFWHKFVGNIPYVTFFYSHFWDEHCNGHHKTMATPEDPVSSPINRSIYEAIYYGFVGTNVETWKREIVRIKRFHPNISTPMLYLQNRMTHYWLLHLLMVIAIYQIFGIGGLKYQFTAFLMCTS